MSTKRLYVGNIPYDATKDELQSLFSPYGRVLEVNIVSDKETGRSRGFAFVEMMAEDADKALWSLNETDFGGRKVIVNEAREREKRGGRSEYTKRPDRRN